MKIHQIDSREREYKEAMAVVDANRPKVAHTPGPWLRSGTTVYALMHHRSIKGVETFRNRFFCSVQRDIKCSQEEAEANAKLMEAAPDLLEALIVLRERHQIDDPHHANLCEFCKQADYAIAKAKGAA